MNQAAIRVGTGVSLLHAQATALMLALQYKHSETGEHSTRVAMYAVRIGRALGLSKDELRTLHTGALLHDIGKLKVSDAVLNNTTGLTEDEWAQLKEHPWRGANLLRSLDFPESICRIVDENHERVDGSGYPFGLKGEEIALGARIVAVADTFDAITSDRCYRRGECYEVACHEIAGLAGDLFDADVVEAFLSIPKEKLVRTK